MTPFDELNIQPRVADLLGRFVANNRYGHALLFHGQKGVGKMLAARVFAQAVNCTENPVNPCGVCRSCDSIKRSMDPQNVVHPDMMHLVPGCWVSSEGRKQASDTIVIDAVRQLQTSLYKAPLSAKYRVVFVHDADKMLVPAQNAFLKTLEEPQERLRTIFILSSSRPLNLLPTVRSRCHEVFFGPVSAKEIQRKLVKEHDVDVGKAAELSKAADGSLGTAIGLADENELQKREDWLDLWINTVKLGPSGFSQLDKLGRSRSDLPEFLDLLLSWHRDLLLLTSGRNANGLIFNERKEDLKQEAEKLTPNQVSTRMERILELRGALSVFIRGDLALKRLLGEILTSSQTR